MLPGVDGIEICKRIREYSIYHAIMLVGKDVEIV